MALQTWMKPTPAPVPHWVNPAIAEARVRVDQASRHFVTLEAERRRLVARAATDYPSSVQLDKLMGTMAEADRARRAALEALEKAVAIECGVNTLLPRWAALRAQLTTELARLKREPDALAADAFLALATTNLECEVLRTTLLGVIGPEAAVALGARRPFDAVAQLRGHWETVHRDREALFHQRVRLPRPVAWAEVADRLSRLRA